MLNKLQYLFSLHLLFNYLNEPLIKLAIFLPVPVWLLIMHTHRPNTTWWMLIIVSPILEELALRGTLQGLLLNTNIGNKRYGNLSIANLITALIFSLLHVVNYASLWKILTIFPGLIFGFFRERCQSLIPAILLHSYYNAGLLLFTYLDSLFFR